MTMKDLKSTINNHKIKIISRI